MAQPLALLFYLLCFCFIPRISGSRARTTRISASDAHPLPRLNHTVSGNTTLSTTSPGFFLNLQISRHWSLVKVYGHKHAGASLYGVHLTLSGGRFEMIDGHDPSIPHSLDHQPTCIFSLSIDQKEDSSLELFNLYDRRFGEYGTITFSFAEYIPQDKAHDLHTHLCEHHISSFNNASALLPRDGNTFTSTQPPEVIGDKTNIVIGLLAALIIIVLAIFIVVTIYVLRLRRQAVLHHTKRDPEVKSEDSQDRPLDKSIPLTSVTATETLQPGSQAQVYKDPWLEQPRSTAHTDPTSSLPPRSEQIPISRYPSKNNPPTSPPREPIPEVPKAPIPSSPTKYEILQEFPVPPNTHYPKSTRMQESLGYTTTTPASRPNDTLRPLRLAEPAQIHNPDTSASHGPVSFRSTGRHHHSRFSKPLPLPEIPQLSLSSINPTITHSPQNSNGSSKDRPGYIDITRHHTGVYNGMQAIHKSSTTRMGIAGPNRPPGHATHKSTRSLDNAGQAQSLRQDLPKTSLENRTTITTNASKDTANLHGRKPSTQASNDQHIRSTRLPKPPQPDNKITQATSSVPLLDDPEKWLVVLQHEEKSVEPVKNTDRMQMEARRITPLRISKSAVRRTGGSARVETNQQYPGENKPVAILAQQQGVTSSPGQDPPIQTRPPQRALPKPHPDLSS